MHITESELWAAMDAAVAQARPAGSRTAQECATAWQCDRRTAAERLRRLVAAGQVRVTAALIAGRMTHCFTPCTPTSANSLRTKKTK